MPAEHTRRAVLDVIAHLEELRAAADDRPVVYARLLELIVLAGLDEARVLASLPSSDIAPVEGELPAPPPRRAPRWRR